MVKRKTKTKRGKTRNPRLSDAQMAMYLSQGGNGVFGNINNWLKKTKVLSKVAPVLLNAIPGGAGYALPASQLIKQMGYGQRGNGYIGSVGSRAKF